MIEWIPIKAHAEILIKLVFSVNAKKCDDRFCLEKFTIKFNLLYVAVFLKLCCMHKGKLHAN